MKPSINLQVVSMVGTALDSHDPATVRSHTGDWPHYADYDSYGWQRLNFIRMVAPSFGSSEESISANLPKVADSQVKLRAEFDRLAFQWHRETKMLSSLNQIVLHPAYQRIIAMGPAAIPLILDDLKNTRAHWLWALNMLTGKDQAKPGQKYHEAVDAWLRWGETRSA